MDVDKMGEVMLAPNWKLVPVDSRNWELCRLSTTQSTPVTRRNGTVGEVRWHRCGRYYSYNTVAEALLYVADELMKERAHGRHMELQDALREYREIADSLRQAVAR